MSRVSPPLAVVLVASLALVARAGDALPEKRPADVTIEFSYGGGMRGDSTALVISAGGGFYKASLRGKELESTTFEVKRGDLDALYAVLRENSLAEIERAPGLVHDKPGHTISVTGMGVSVHLGTSGANIAAKWETKFRAIVDALGSYQRRVVEALRQPYLVAADASLAGRSYRVTLGDRIVLLRRPEGSTAPVARTVLHLLPGIHVFRVAVDANERNVYGRTPEAHGLKLSVAGDTITGTELLEADPGIMKIDAAETGKNGLPPINLELDLGAAGLSKVDTPAKDAYLRLSGPPGGPLGLVVEPYRDQDGSTAALEKLAAARFAGQTYAKGSADTVDVGGRGCLALTCSTGSSHAHAVHLLVLVPGPGGKSGVLVDFWVSHGSGETPSPSAVMKLERWGDLLRSVRVSFEQAESIGSATMEKDGTIVLQLRAQTGATVGDALLRYPRSHAKYAEILEHLGGLEPGQSKPVRPFPD